MQQSPQNSELVKAYHRRSKHGLQHYAAGPGGLDWDSQPNPFRSFTGCARLELPLLDVSASSSFADLYTPGKIVAKPITVQNIAALLELSFGLSAWKQFGQSRWALRCNPSSGNLHPTESYVVTAERPDMQAGVYHYLSRDHALEQRCAFSTRDRDAYGLPEACFLVGLTSIHWREAWKYGERAFRYCQHDVGHAMAALRYAAASLGWQVHALTDCADTQIAALLGIDRDPDFDAAEREHPDVLLVVTPGLGALASENIRADVWLSALAEGLWQGRANVLSAYHAHHWPVIDEVVQACVKPVTRTQRWQLPDLPAPQPPGTENSAWTIIKQRRSAQAFDGVSEIPSTVFYRMLDMTLPRSGTPPWDEIDWKPRLHLVLFVHRVSGLEPGLYIFLRNPEKEGQLRKQLTATFEWTPVVDCPAHFGLFRLVHADARDAARILSCHQDIASDSAFSLGMLADYEDGLAEGAWVYRQMFWEAGMIGQVLYLEAEAAGLRGTGIGCYFDDAFHELLGIQNEALQSLYHFTAGTPKADTRLETLPAYGHLQRALAR